MEQKSQVFLRFRISYKSPIFEESKFAYIHGHDATGDFQINFSFKSDTDGTILKNFNSLKKWRFYEMTRIIKDKSTDFMTFVEVFAKTIFKEATEGILEIPRISPMITKEQITFSNSIVELKKDRFYNIIGRVIDCRIVSQRKDGTVIRKANKIYLELSTREITGVCLWEKREVDLSFERGSYMIFRNLEKADGPYDLKCTFHTSILTLSQEGYQYVPQMMSFRKFRPTQDTGLRCMTIEEMKNEMSLSHRKGEFEIENIVTSASYRYPKCTQCSRKTSKQESSWVCDSGHSSVTPVYALRLKAIVSDQSGSYTKVSFLDEMGKELLGEDAETILLSEDQEQITKALNQLEGKLFYLGIKQSLKNGKQSGWIVYEIASLNEELAE